MTNVKPGDLAIVVGAYLCTENIGRIVEVVRVAVPGVDVASTCSEIAWVVRSSYPLGRAHQGRKVRMRPALEAPCADCNLRPVSGLPVGDEVKDEAHA